MKGPIENEILEIVGKGERVVQIAPSLPFMFRVDKNTQTGVNNSVQHGE